MAIENFVQLIRRAGTEVPERFMETLHRGLQQPIAWSRPDQGQIDLNDGGWGMVDDHYSRITEHLFPEDPVFQWMATKGASGAPPEFTSIYMPNSGHIIQRTGWGDSHKYLFMDAGPMGASHGKNDKLNLYLAIGPHQLISSGGRGSYDANPFSAYAGSTYGYNTVIVDDLPQQRVHLKHTHTGHIPEKRRWISNERFDYAEGFYRSGWFGPKKHVAGLHHRQVVFVKGDNPPRTGYWIVIDSVQTDDKEPHRLKALFHSRRNFAEVDSETKSYTCVDRGAGFRILAANRNGLELKNVRGQMSPYVQGWHVVGTNRAPMHTAEYQWNAIGTSYRVWIVEATLAPATWQIESASSVGEASKFELKVQRTDGKTDRLTSVGLGRETTINLQSQGNDGPVVLTVSPN